MEWSRSQGLELVGGRGLKHGTLYFVLKKDGMELRPFNFYEDNPREAFLYVYFEGMGPSFADQHRRAELCDRFNRIEGVNISPEKSYPGIPLPKLEAEAALETALGALEWMLSRMHEGL